MADNAAHVLLSHNVTEGGAAHLSIAGGVLDVLGVGGVLVGLLPGLLSLSSYSVGRRFGHVHCALGGLLHL